MDQIQYDRWKDFALRMARNAFQNATPQRIDRLVGEIEGFFESVEYQIKWGAKLKELTCWDGDFAGTCFCDFFNEHFEGHDHQWTWDDRYAPGRSKNRFLSMIHCCIRAGLDMASEPSGGVVGFTKADIENMYPEGVPDWIRNNGEGWCNAFDDKAPGVPWDEIATDQQLWL